jgi:mRNA-degrading endonuclease RelE of RelBE toxin-antitoxin system
MSKARKRPLVPPAARNVEPQAASSTFEFSFTEDAGAEIKDLDGGIRKQLRNVLGKKLAIDPEGYGLPLRGPLAGYWKHEFGSHRVIYRIYADLRIVAVCAVGSRKQGDAQDIYNQLNKVVKSGRLAEQVASVLSKIIPKQK